MFFPNIVKIVLFVTWSDIASAPHLPRYKAVCPPPRPPLRPPGRPSSCLAGEVGSWGVHRRTPWCLPPPPVSLGHPQHLWILHNQVSTDIVFTTNIYLTQLSLVFEGHQQGILRRSSPCQSLKSQDKTLCWLQCNQGWLLESPPQYAQKMCRVATALGLEAYLPW